MNNCEQENLVCPYHDGELDELRRLQVENHLTLCGVCRQRLREFQGLTERLSRVSVNGMSQMEQARMHWVVERARVDLSSRALMRLAMPLLGMAASLLVVTSVWLVDNGGVGRSARTGTLAQSDSSDWQRVAMNFHSDNKLPDWMVRSLGGDRP